MDVTLVASNLPLAGLTCHLSLTHGELGLRSRRVRVLQHAAKLWPNTHMADALCFVRLWGGLPLTTSTTRRPRLTVAVTYLDGTDDFDIYLDTSTGAQIPSCQTPTHAVSGTGTVYEADCVCRQNSRSAETQTRANRPGPWEGKLSPQQRFGILKILYKKGDRRLLTNYRPLAITSILYKIKATVLQLRWKKVLPAAIAECQHGFVYKRRQFENVFKIRDAAHLADQTEVSYRYLLHGNIDGIDNDTSAAAARSSYNRYMKEGTISAALYDGGLSFPKPVYTIRAMLCELPADRGYAKFLVYGRATHTPVDTTIRGVALDTIRMMRAVRTSQYHEAAKKVRQNETKWHIAGPPTKAEIQKAVGARLACAMHEDWRAAIGQHSKTDRAAKSARPMTTTEFNRRWAAVCDIIEGRCVPRPDRINSHRAEN